MARFLRRDADAGAYQDERGGVATRERDAVDTPRRDRDVDTRVDRDRTTDRDTLTDRDAHARRREEFGGFNLGAAFFGWLVAVGMAVLLTALLAAAGAAIGLTEGGANADDAGTVSIVGGALLVAVLALAYYCGGYVAGRMSRFDGGRQGFGTWLIGLVVTVLIAGAGALFGSEYNVLSQLNLPRIPIDEGDLATGGAIALAAALIGTLIAAVVGGKVGRRYHSRVDRAGWDR